MAMPSNLLSAADRQQVRDAIWGLGSDGNLSFAQRATRRRHIFAVTNEGRIFNRFLDRSYDKYVEEKATGPFREWIVQYIKDHPEEIIKLIAFVLKLFLV